MNFEGIKKPRTILLCIVLIILTILSFYIRAVPAFSGNPDILTNVGMDDPTYHLRQVEQTIANFPTYSWFDPMTYFPQGQPMHWGPLFTVLSAALCLLAGATTRTDIISVCLLIPPITAALMVPIVYLIVTRVADWKSGLISALFMAIVPGQFFFRSYYGYFDHHIHEVFFSSLFCLLYIYALVYCRKNPVKIQDRQTWNIPIIIGILCGISYALGLALMPTMILFALIVGIFIPFWFIIQRYSGHLGASALIINTTTFIVAIIGFFIIGVHADQGGLNYYTLGHPIAYGMLILATWVMFAFSYYLREKPFYHYVLALIGVSILGIILFALIFPAQYNYLFANLVQFFGEDIHWKTIQEARPWTVDDAWHTFQYSFVLFAGGVAVLLYRIRKELCPSHVFLLLWSVIIFYATCEHIRYEYYLAVPIAIVSGICVGFAADLAWKRWHQAETVSPTIEKNKKGSEKKERKDTHAGSQYGRYTPVILLIFVLIIAYLFSSQALATDLSVGAFSLNSDWREATTWLGENTPDPGVDYLKLYNKDDWAPPNQSYGVMSWWDYGHIITYLGKRMPNANPFQYGVDGDYGAARFFLTQSEDVATGILDKLKTKYVITDTEMDTGKFWAMATWNDTEIGATPFQRFYLIPNPDNPSTGSQYPFTQGPYYETMISRLHNFDGSLTEPNTVYYIQYLKPNAKISVPVIVNGSITNYTQGMELVSQFDASKNPEYGVALVNTLYTSPVSEVGALDHFRLIHESPTRTTQENMPDVRYVKIFEYVPGAKIAGDGILEIPVQTNTGREFTYRQKSVNGSFTVPYPTNTKISDITTLGPYKNVETGKEYTVTEEQIQKGESIS